MPGFNSNLGGPALGGGPVNGFSPKQTINAYKDNNDDVIARRILIKSWNSRQLFSQQGRDPRVGPFRAVNNLGDFLGRVNYSCGGPNPQSASKPGYGRLIGSIPQQCDGTGIEPTNCNPKFVSDSSDYIKFKRLRAVNHNYNDLSNGGNQSNASYVPLMAIRRR
jgi:hypothetical protein